MGFICYMPDLIWKMQWLNKAYLFLIPALNSGIDVFILCIEFA